MFHRLLQRQLKKAELKEDALPTNKEAWSKLLSSIDRLYVQADNDRELLERSLKISSEEMKRLYEEVKLSNEDLEKRVQKRTAELQDAYNELESFSYSVSHDLRAPIRHISGYVQLIQQNKQTSLDQKGERHMQNIIESAQKMAQLVDGLIEFSKKGHSALKQSTLNLDDLVEEVRDELKPEMKDREIEWTITPLPKVQADHLMFKQVLINLISNALKYTRPRKPAQIEIGSKREDPNKVVIFVKDNGVGFDMQYAHKLFGVFQRLHRPEEFEGTGIGLANVNRIIKRHGGRVWAESVIDQGATFYCSLPEREAA